MKRLLLTLLGASLLCGLSPHPLSAQSTQTVSMDLALRTSDHNTDLTYTIGETTSPWFDAAITSPENDKAGFDKIENSDFLIEFDYFDPLAGETGNANVKSNFTTKFGSALIPTLNLYPGMRFRITLKDKTKRILSLKIKSGIVSTTFTSAYVNYNTHPVASLSEGGNDSKISFAHGTYKTVSPDYELTEISFSRSFDGMENGVTLELPKTGCYNIGKYNGGKVTAAKTAEFVYNIAGIEAEVMAVDDLPKTGRIYGSVADAEVWDEATSKWIRPTQSTYDGNTVKFRTGKVITEFIRTSGAIADKPTVTYDAASATLGAHVGVDVRSYPDGSVTYKGSPATTYITEYRLNNPFKSTTLSSAFASSMGLLASLQAPTAANDQWKAGLKKYNDGSSLTLTYVLYSLEADADKKKVIGLSKSIARLSNTFGLSDTTTISIIPKVGNNYPRFQDPTIFETTNIPSGANNNAKNGEVPTFVFDEIDLTITTEEATGSRAPSLAAQAADGDIALKQSDGSWLFKSTINIGATLDDEDFPEAKLYYMTGAAPATSFDKSNATEVPTDGIIAYNATGFVTVFAVVTVDGKEIASSPASIAVKKFESESAATYADLLKIKDGSTVTINFTTRTRFTSYINRTVTNTVPYWPFAFIYDNDGNPIKVSAIHLSDLGTTQTHLNSLLTGPGEPASKAKIFVNPAATLDDDKFIEAGSITGRLHLVDGHPEIILVDEFNDDKFDWRDFCGTVTKTSAEIGMTAEQKAAADKAFAREYNSTELLPEHWGRFVTLHRLTSFNATDSTFIDKDSKGKAIKLVYGTTNSAPYPMIPGFCISHWNTMLTAFAKGNTGTRYSLIGLVDTNRSGDGLQVFAKDAYYNVSKPVFSAKYMTIFPNEKDTPDDDADQTFVFAGLTRPTASLGLSFTVDQTTDQPKTTQTTLSLEYYDLNQDGKALTLQQLPTAKAKNGRYHLRIVAKIAATTTQPEQRDSSIVSLHDLVMQGATGTFFDEIANLTPADIEKNPYVWLEAIPQKSGSYPTPHVYYPTLMVYDVYGSNMLVREVRRDLESDDKTIIPGTSYPKWYIVKSTTTRKPKYFYGNNNNKWSSSNRSTPIGAADGITELTAKAEVNEHGNLIFNNDGGTFTAYCLTEGTSSSENKKPIFINEYDELATAVEFNDIAKATIGKEHLNMMVNLPDAVITKDADGEYRVNTATANALAWNILRTDDKDTHTGLIDQAQEGDRFAVKALVVNDGKGGYALEVVDFKAGYARSLHVCDHPSHDSYFAKQNFDGVDAGKQVEMLGVKLTKDADGKVTTELSSTVSLVWTSFANLEESHKALIMDEDPATKQTITFNVAGTLLRGDDGTVSIDVNELTQVKSYGYSQDFQNMFVINDAPYNLYLDPQYNNIIDYIKVEARGPGYLTAYYRYSPTLEGLEDAAEVEFDESRIAKLGVTGYYEFYTCNPGKRGLYRHVPRLFTKISSNAGSISDILDNGADATSFHYTGHLLITGAVRHDYSNEYGEPVTDYVAMATDNDGRHVRLTFRPEYNFIPEAGQYIADLGFFKVNHSDYELKTVHKDINLLAASNFKPVKPVEPDEADRIDMPKSIVRAGLDAADKGRRVRLIDMKISGNDTDGYNLTPANGTEPIRLNNVLYWTPAEGFDPDGEYAIEGYVMPAKPAEATASLTALADTEDEVEFWPLYEEAKRQTGKPELTVEGYESVEGNSYVTVEPVKLTAAVVDGPDANAPIEYSIDGGEWTVMTDGTLTVDRSASISVRAHIPGFSPSETLSVDIKREYYSAEAVIAAEQKSGYTAVTFAAGENASADTDFTVYYTLDGTEPDMNSEKFTAGMKPLELTEAANVKALMVENGKRPAKSIASQDVAIRANDLEITYEKGEGFTKVAIAPKDPKHVDPKAEIRYTTDGTEPTPASQLYTAPFEVEAADNGMTVKAICIEPQKTDGLVATRTVAVEGLRPSCDVTIDYSEKDGVYYITLTAEAGTIHYSLNGAEEKIYDGKPIEYTSAADGTCTITAYALEEGKRAGKTATESFAVTGISGVGADEAESVRVEGNTIIVPEGAQTFDIAGRRVNPTALPRGIYIVRLASGKAVKAVVK